MPGGKEPRPARASDDRAGGPVRGLCIPPAGRAAADPRSLGPRIRGIRSVGHAMIRFRGSFSDGTSMSRFLCEASLCEGVLV